MAEQNHLEISKSNLTLHINNSQNIFMSAFSGFLTFGKIEEGVYTKQSACIPVYKLDDFIDEIEKVISYFESNESANNFSLTSLIGSHRWEGKTNVENSTLSKKTVFFFKSEIKIFVLTDNELIHFLGVMVRIILMTFLFNDKHLLFFEQLIQTETFFTASQTLDSLKFKQFADKFCSENKCSHFALKQIVGNHRNEIEMIFRLSLRLNLLVQSDIGF